MHYAISASQEHLKNSVFAMIIVMFHYQEGIWSTSDVIAELNYLRKTHTTIFFCNRSFLLLTFVI